MWWAEMKEFLYGAKTIFLLKYLNAQGLAVYQPT